MRIRNFQTTGDSKRVHNDANNNFEKRMKKEGKKSGFRWI